MSRVRRLVDYVAPSPSTVLLLGESGTGKEVAAESIHAASPIRDHPLVRVNCMAIPSELMESELFGHVRGAFTGANVSRKGWFELANGGTLFLDEIGDLPMSLQGKLLRVLEDGRITRVGSRHETPVEIRLIAATNQDLPALVHEGRFREDLYYRLNVFPITLPALRERIEDLPELVEAVRVSIATRLERPLGGVSEEALALLARYEFPGNVRELRNLLERAFILAGHDDVGPEHLPEDLFLRAAPCSPSGGPEAGSFHEQVERTKALILLDTLRATNWVKKDAAARLGLTPRAFSHYVAKFDLDAHRATG